MAKYETDFSEYANGALPSDWSNIYTNPGTNYISEIRDSDWAYAPGKLLFIGGVINASDGIAHFLSCAALNNAANVEILGLYASGTGQGIFMPYSTRMIIAGGNHSRYVIGSTYGERLGVSIVSGAGSGAAPTEIGYVDWKVVTSSYYWMRASVQGTALKVKRWFWDHVEPAYWQYEVTHSSILTSQYTCISTYPNESPTTYPRHYYFAGATAGETLSIPDNYNGDIYFGSGSPGSISTINASSIMEGGLIGAGRYLLGATVRFGSASSAPFRVAVYTGGSLTDPTGAQLLVDFGTFTTASTIGQTITVGCPTTEIPAGPVWLVVKTTRQIFVNTANSCRLDGAALGEWQFGNSYYTLAGASTDGTQAFSSSIAPGWSNTGSISRILQIQLLVGPSSNLGVIVPRNANLTDSYTLSDSTRVSIQEPYFFYEDLATFKSQLANRLNDPDMIYWTPDELLTIIHEALRTLSLLTWYNGYRLECTPNGAFQNLYTIDPMRLGMTMTDREMINRMQYDLMENITADWISGWNGTDQFNLADLTHALQKRRNRFLGETGAVITRVTNGDITLTNDGIIKIPDSIIDVRRVAWKDSVGYRNLWRAAEEELTSYDPSWTPAAVQDPLYYSELAIKQSHMQLAPAPSVLNDMELLTLSAGADFQPSLEPTAMGVHDDMAWVVKWGALAEVLGGDNPAKDPERAAYCEKRYQHGVEMANNYTTILAARIGTAPIQVVTLAELDAYNGDWQKATPGAPQMVATAGLNYVAFYPPADGSTTISLDITRSAQLPWGDSDFIQLGRELYSPVLDYCVHLAMFKVGGAEFQATMPLLENFFEMCSNYNKRMEACSRLWRDMDKITNAEEMTRLRIKNSGDPRTPENWGAGKVGGR